MTEYRYDAIEARTDARLATRDGYTVHEATTYFMPAGGFPVSGDELTRYAAIHATVQRQTAASFGLVDR